MQAIDVKFSQDLTHQKSLKLVNFWQSYLKIKSWTFFLRHSVVFEPGIFSFFYLVIVLNGIFSFIVFVHENNTAGTAAVCRQGAVTAVNTCQFASRYLIFPGLRQAKPSRAIQSWYYSEKNTAGVSSASKMRHGGKDGVPCCRPTAYIEGAVMWARTWLWELYGVIFWQ